MAISKEMLRRSLAFLFALPLLAEDDALERLAARWRSRITVIRNGRPMYTRLRLTFAASGGFNIEEYATGGQLAWVYKGTARVSPKKELFLEVSAVTDANGTAAETGRARYEAGESYNLGAMEFLSTARVRVGALELQKELE